MDDSQQTTVIRYFNIKGNDFNFQQAIIYYENVLFVHVKGLFCA